MTKISFAFAAVAISLAISGQASAGPNCAPGAARYSAPKVAAAKPAAAPRAAVASKPAPAKVATAGTELSGGDGDGKPAPVVRKAEPKVEAKVEAPAVQQQAAVAKPAAEESADYTSVSGVAARLAALAAQQAASARNNGTTAQ